MAVAKQSKQVEAVAPKNLQEAEASHKEAVAKLSSAGEAYQVAKAVAAKTESFVRSFKAEEAAKAAAKAAKAAKA